MNTRTNWILACAGLALAFAAAAPATPNLLVDPSFELNPLTTFSNVLNNFPAYQGFWGVEAATLTVVENGVTPAQGFWMLRMVDDGLVTTQGVQVTDVTSYAALINSGGATVNMSALFTAGATVPGAGAGVVVQFFSAANYGSQIGSPLIGSLTLDNFGSTWETVSVSGTIPIGTTWLASQVYYGDASLNGNPGYVDAAELTIVPEPASMVGLLVVAATALRMRRR
jgi:hypothetical protein